jgi:ATP-dependent helicase/nuclease subunit B
LADTLIQILTPLSEYFSSTSVSFKDIFKLHICLAEKLASSADTAGKKLLWRGEAGKCAAQFSTKILETADTLGPIDGMQYLPLLCELMGMETVRAQYGTHPRLSILGPIEAKLSHFDYVILGEINEGIWPKPAHSDMWMSRPMKKDFGFSLPEKNTGILADDLCHFLAMPNILLTRAERIDGVPMKKSRWLLRLETVLKALGGDILSLQDPAFSDFVNHVDRPVTYTPISSPAPCPPLSARPRKLSASGIDLLLQDPYSVFAKYILNLYPFEDLDKALDARDYGTLIHAILEEFNTSHTGKLPENPLEILIDIGKKHFYRSQLSSEIKAFWWPSFERTANWIIKQETGYRDNIKSIYNEISGEMTYPLPHGNFTFTAKADRIDELTDGTLNIIDYKTGTPPKKKQINAFYALQLPIEALIAQKGGFSLIKSSMVNKMIYWKLGKFSSEILPENDDFLQKAENRLVNLVEAFDSDKTPYLPRPFPKYVSKNKDYEHLSRIREWSVLEEGEDDD